MKIKPKPQKVVKWQLGAFAIQIARFYTPTEVTKICLWSNYPQFVLQ